MDTFTLDHASPISLHKQAKRQFHLTVVVSTLCKAKIKVKLILLFLLKWRPEYLFLWAFTSQKTCLLGLLFLEFQVSVLPCLSTFKLLFLSLWILIFTGFENMTHCQQQTALIFLGKLYAVHICEQNISNSLKTVVEFNRL